MKVNKKKESTMHYLILFMLISFIHADQRHFVNTYETVMLESEESEIEFYYTNEFPTSDIADNKNLNTLKLQVEIEIGMSEFLEVGFYNTFKEYPLFDNNGDFTSRKFEYDEYKLKLKYKVFKNTKPWTPLFYSELKGKPDFSSWTIEQKLIFTKYFGNMNLSINPIIEFENEKNDGEWEREFEAELAMGIAFLKEHYSFGFDMKSSEYATYLGPVFAHGNEEKWWSIGLMKKVSGEETKNELIIKSIMGFHF